MRTSKTTRLFFKEIVLLSILSVVGCQDSNETENIDDAFISALPRPIAPEGNAAECEPPYIWDSPDEEALVAASTSIVIGNISRVELVREPFVITDMTNKNDTIETTFRIGTESDCTESIRYRADIHLSNIETLAGERMPGTIKVRTLLNQWDLRPIASTGNHVQWLDLNDKLTPLKDVFSSGSTIGGSIRRGAVTGHLFFQFRLFEVVNDKIYLQNLDPKIEDELKNGPASEVCPVASQPAFTLSSDHDGMALNDFKAKIQGIVVDPSVMRQTHESLERYISAMEQRVDTGPHSKLVYEPDCVGKADLPSTSEQAN